jgi:hypothetical protein
MLCLLLLFPLLSVGLRVPHSPFPTPSNGLNASSSLYIFYTDALSPADAFTLQLLQGVVNKRAPTLARAARGSSSELWLNSTRDLWGIALNYSFAQLPPLVAHFAPSLQGYVLCSFTDGSVNVAVAAATALNVLAVTPDNAALATAAGLPLLHDLRGTDLAYALATFNNTPSGFAFSRTVTTLQEPGKSQGCMADYSIANGALQWWASAADSAQAEAVWGSMAPPFAALGWGPDELGTVTAVSRHGGGVVASDWASNIDVLAAFDLPELRQQEAPPAPAPPAPYPAAVHTVAFLMSDGDNLQFLLGGFATSPNWWGSPARGSVPMGWTLSAAAADLAPVLPAHLYASASALDLFVGGVSGMGYFYPDQVPPPLLPALANLTAGYLQKAGLRVLNVLAAGDGAPPEQAVESLLAQPGIEALLWYPYSDYSGLRGAIQWSAGGKPVIGGRFNLWGNASDPARPTFQNTTGLAQALLQQARDGSRAEGYSLVPVHAWTHTVADAAEVVRLVQAQLPGGVGVDFVTPEVLVQRVVAQVKRF